MYKKIMVPLDGSELAECVFLHIEGFIASRQVNTIVFVRVLEPDPMTFHGSYVTNEVDLEKIESYTKKSKEKRKSTAEEYLKQVVNRLKRNGVKFQTEVLVGKVADRLVAYIEANDFDLILIATHGRSGVSRWVRGSVADRILHASHIPILMVQAPVGQ